MAAKVKTTPATSGDETPVELLAKYGKVSLADAADIAATIGDVPSMGGVQQSMCMLMLAIGTRARKEGVKDYDHAPVVQAFFNNYYGPGKGVGRTAKPESVDNYVSSYGRWLKAGMLTAWDAKPLAIAATEATAITSLSGRAALINSFMKDEKRTVAPTEKEIATAIAGKTPKKKGKGNKDTAKPATLSDHAVAVSALLATMNTDEVLQRFIKANPALATRYQTLSEASALFSADLNATLASPKGQKAEEKLRTAAIAAAQKVQQEVGAKAN
jgi:hypothetical protein